MTPAKRDAALQGISAIARKVYDATPIAEAWTPSQIKNALATSTRSSTDLHTVRGCLRALVDVGLASQKTSGHYQRVPVRQPTHIALEDLTMPAATPNNAAPAATRSSMEVFADLANQAKTMSKQLQHLAQQIEEAALQAEAERESQAARFSKLEQLSSLLKDLNGGATP